MFALCRAYPAILAAGLACCPILGLPQETLSLNQALQMAKERNGTVAAAFFAYRASQSQANQSYSSFWPRVTPTYSYETSRTNHQTGSSVGANSAGDTFEITASWTLLDNGRRKFQFESAKHLAEAQERQSLQTLRTVLFNVHTQYFDALRAQELRKVQASQLQRAEKILDQTKKRIAAQLEAQKNELQADADRLNSQASLLAAENQVSNTQATLKATIGWQSEKDLPQLQELPEPNLPPLSFTLDEAFKRGTQNRADLQAQRDRLNASKSQVRLAQADGGISWTVDTQFTKAFAPNVLDRSQLVLQATVPLFDGFRSREAVRAAKFSYDADKADLTQAEREARSEIESAYKQYATNFKRLEATTAAIKAARKNFDAAQKSNAAGAGTLIEELTAQVSLVTAESNYVEAVYDSLIADIRLKLAMGEPIPGEEMGRR